MFAMSMSKEAEQQLKDRAAVMKLAEVGWTGGAIIRELGLTRTFVYKWLGRAKGQGSVLDAPRPGRPKKLQKRLSQTIVKLMEGNATRVCERLQRCWRRRAHILGERA